MARSFAQVVDARLSRRDFLKAGTALAVAAALPGCASSAVVSSSASGKSALTFMEQNAEMTTQLEVPAGYQAQVLLKWGEPLWANGPAFDPTQQTAEKQQQQFGFNNDFIGFLPLPLGSQNSEHGLLVVNHEYSISASMWPGSPADTALDKAQTDTDIVAHGLSVVEIQFQNGQWQQLKDSAYTRRITPLTPMQLSGPAAGSPRLKTAISADGVHTLGTYGNCAGGVTPWGTVLTGEENIDAMFAGDYSQSAERETLQRFGMQAKAQKSWAQHYPRWDLSQQPNEALHVGWIVEIDPYNPQSTPKKRTLLGRFKHEGANVFINADGRVVAYMGDDQKFEYLYKFVSSGRYQPDHRAANLDLLDSGTLHCARFDADGTVDWLPLQFGQGPLTAANGFHSQADVLIDCRKAADLLGATPMDRPEDVEVNPANGAVYVMLTKNADRTEAQRHPVNPRANNTAGQIVELVPPKGDHSQPSFAWDLFLLAGRRDDPSSSYHPATGADSWIACPDNCAFDSKGHIWVTSDGAEDFGIAEGVWASAVSGPDRALMRRFLRSPVGSEVCGPFFTPDDKHFFCSIQHPGDGSSFEQPSTRWPDFDATLPPRPAVVVINRPDGKVVGS
ncbi:MULTISPECIES: PhoX family protein [Rheinheimera]|uniref:PhoX family protein n=1 Tax=Rheinheimera marina TaxID=1774958 RepID=A0ABV9JH09_9GAMM